MPVVIVAPHAHTHPLAVLQVFDGGIAPRRNRLASVLERGMEILPRVAERSHVVGRRLRIRRKPKQRGGVGVRTTASHLQLDDVLAIGDRVLWHFEHVEAACTLRLHDADLFAVDLNDDFHVGRLLPPACKPRGERRDRRAVGPARRKPETAASLEQRRGCV